MGSLSKASVMSGHASHIVRIILAVLLHAAPLLASVVPYNGPEVDVIVAPRSRRAGEIVGVVPDMKLAREVKVPLPTKKAALLLDKIMFAVQKALDEEEGQQAPAIPSISQPVDIASYNEGMGLERRGNSHNRVYWRCYFNAVSCF